MTCPPSSVAAYTQQTATALDLADPTTTDVSDYAAYLYTETVDFFNDVAAPGYTPPEGRPLSGPGAPLPGYGAPLLGTGWETSANFTTFDPSFSFTLTSAQSAALTNDAVWAEDEPKSPSTWRASRPAAPRSA